MVFELTSKQKASHDFIHTELTKGSVSVELTFPRDLVDNIEILLLGERNSIFCVTSEKKLSKKTLLPTLLIVSGAFVSMANMCYVPASQIKVSMSFCSGLVTLFKIKLFHNCARI